MIVSTDFETFYDPASGYSLNSVNMSEYILDPRFRALGCGLRFDGQDKALWIPEDKLASTLERLKPQFEGAVMLAHNTLFDAAIMAWHYGIVCKGYLDTLAMARSLGHRKRGAGGGSLKALCEHYGLGTKPDLRPDSTPEELKLRGTWDCYATLDLFKILVKGYPKKELHAIDLTVRQYIQRVIEADVEELEKFKDEKETLRADLLERLGRTEADMQSAALFADALYQLGVDPPTKKSKATSQWTWAFAKTDDGMKSLLEDEDENVRALAEARLEIKSTGDVTRANTFLRLARYGGLPVAYRVSGAHTHRWSGDDGTNFTNLKRGGRLRDCLVAPAGHVFVVGDRSQVEARINATLAGQEDLIEGFRSGADVYCEFAAMAFGKSVTKADEYERFAGKTTVLGAGFQCGPKRMWRQMRGEIFKRRLDIPIPEFTTAKMLVDTYRRRYSKVPVMWGNAEALINQPGKTLGPVISGGDRLLMPDGLPILYPELSWDTWHQVNDDGDSESKTGWRYAGVRGRTALYGGAVTENIVQGLARNMHRDSMIVLAKHWCVAMHTYDEVALIVPENEAEDAKAEMEAALTAPPAWMPDVPLACEIGIGERYGDCK